MYLRLDNICGGHRDRGCKNGTYGHLTLTRRKATQKLAAKPNERFRLISVWITFIQQLCSLRFCIPH
jgi:hypothetical protein